MVWIILTPIFLMTLFRQLDPTSQTLTHINVSKMSVLQGLKWPKPRPRTVFQISTHHFNNNNSLLQMDVKETKNKIKSITVKCFFLLNSSIRES